MSAAPPTQHNGTHIDQGNSIPPPTGASIAPSHDPPQTDRLYNNRPPSKAHRKTTIKPGGYPLAYFLDKEAINIRNRAASSRLTSRKKGNQAQNQHTLMDYWPTLIPASLPLRPRGKIHPLFLPRSLPSMGWTPDPTFVLRTDLNTEASYPFPHSPPGSPHPEEEPISPTYGLTPTPTGQPPQKERDHNMTHISESPTQRDISLPPPGEFNTTGGTSIPNAVLSTNTTLTFLTVNAQKAGPNSPSLMDIVTTLDEHSPDFLFLTETPQHNRSGALAHVLRNRGFRIHYHPANSPSPPDTLPEARTPAHLTHAGGGTWLACRKDAP